MKPSDYREESDYFYRPFKDCLNDAMDYLREAEGMIDVKLTRPVEAEARPMFEKLKAGIAQQVRRIESMKQYAFNAAYADGER